MASPHAESFYCISEESLSLYHRKIYTGTCIGCAAIGFAGSLTQVISLRKLWNFTPRSTNRNHFMPNVSVIFFLAFADLLACSAVITRSVTLALIPPPEERHGQLYPASQLVVDIGAPLQSFLQFFFLATYFWTFFYALDIYLQLSKRNVSNLAYHVFTWLSAGILTGFSEFIVFYEVGFPCADSLRVTLSHMATYIPIACVMLANPIIYVLSYSKLKKLLRREGMFGHAQHRQMTDVTRKFSAYVVIFWICWLPSIATGIYLRVRGVHAPFPFSLWMLTAILNPLQGFFNCFIYGIGSDMANAMHVADRQVRVAESRQQAIVGKHTNVDTRRSLAISPRPPMTVGSARTPAATDLAQDLSHSSSMSLHFASGSTERTPLMSSPGGRMMDGSSTSN